MEPNVADLLTSMQCRSQYLCLDVSKGVMYFHIQTRSVLNTPMRVFQWRCQNFKKATKGPKHTCNTFLPSHNNVSNTNVSSFSSTLLNPILMTMFRIWVTMAFGKVCPLQDGTIKTWALCTQVSIVVNVFQHSLIGVQHGGTIVALVHWLLLCEIWMNCQFWNSLGWRSFYKQDLETSNNISTLI